MIEYISLEIMFLYWRINSGNASDVFSYHSYHQSKSQTETFEFDSVKFVLNFLEAQQVDKIQFRMLLRPLLPPSKPQPP